MIVLLLVGIGFEDRIGTFGFGFIYFVSGIFAVIFFTITNNFELVILIGASGAICGILGAFARLFPREKMTMFFMFFPLPPMPVYVVVAIIFGLEVLFAITGGISFGAVGKVAYTAHIGGILSGFLVAPLIRKMPTKLSIEKINYDKLEFLASTPKLKEILARIKNEDIEEVRKAWLEDFVTHARCPNCRSRLYLRKRKIRCQCGFYMTI
jgi:asparagine N-glycosylation enzyme membrane subunit Stt3